MPSVPPSPKVSVSLEIKTVVEITDDGYLGISATVDEHIKAAQDQLQRWVFLVAKNNSKVDATPIQAQAKVIGITILPSPSGD